MELGGMDFISIFSGVLAWLFLTVMWCSLLSAELNENGVPSSSSWGSGHCGSEGCWWGLPSTPPPLPPRTLKSRSLKKLVADELAVLTVKETHRNNLSASFKLDLNYPSPLHNYKHTKSTKLVTKGLSLAWKPRRGEHYHHSSLSLNSFKICARMFFIYRTAAIPAILHSL